MTNTCPQQPGMITDYDVPHETWVYGNCQRFRIISLLSQTRKAM